MKKAVVGVVTSEKTYNRLDDILFNDAFLANREKFDLAVVFNSDKKINHKFKTEFDYIYFRPNLGYDPAGFNHLINNLPEYDYYFLLHDDHFYNDYNWFDYSINLLEKNKHIDIISNIAIFPLLALFINSQSFQIFLHQLNLAHLIKKDNIYNLICGIAGVYRAKAINSLKQKYGSIPYFNNNNKTNAVYCEVLSTLLFEDCGIKFEQYPGEIFTYLNHLSHSNNHNIDWFSGLKYFSLKEYDKALKYFWDFIKICDDGEYHSEIPFALVFMYIMLKENDAQTAQKFLDMFYEYPIPDDNLREIKIYYKI
ncbi:MAG TPA: hypothetical protein PLP99_03835 [Ignavibacteriales bacterium]|nr:hypothetical protein [Ignavibacteriales bacterium]HOL80875.1 hypothetical protein [Ignavibacteriales bacterium]HPP33310.1 hypothetical protein [Ignavibacteriales bacterium]